jgi:hypothetical protein
MIAFSGSAGTMQGELTGERLVWRSSIDGHIGNGQSFQRDDLSPGQHEITLSAKSASGQVYENSVRIEITERRKRVAAEDNRRRSGPRVFRDPVDGRPYVDTGKGTVVDLTTGLMWEKTPDNRLRNLRGALEYADKLKLHGYSDWRVPTIDELKFISNGFLDQANRQLHLGDNNYLHVAMLCNVFDQVGGTFWALDRSGKFFTVKNIYMTHTVEYKFNDVFNRHLAYYDKTDIQRPGYVRCVRKCDLSKWKRYLAQK